MTWQKRGKIFSPEGNSSWAKHSFMTPTPWQLNEDTIRIFGGMRDDVGVSRIGYIDVDSYNPKIIKYVSQTPVLDTGIPGSFDDNGVILGDIIEKEDNEIYMYYVGFQLVKKVKFLAFTGLAISTDGGYSFNRYSNSPVLDRTDNGLYIRAVHTVIRENNKWRFWCGEGCKWRYIGGLAYPSYEIWYTESDDGINFSKEERLSLTYNNSEYRIGRPRVYKNSNSSYEMYFTCDTLDKQYFSGYAYSSDGLAWERDDSKFSIHRSKDGWDSEMVCYPSLHTTPHGSKYTFYSGNQMGYSGVGYAEWSNTF